MTVVALAAALSSVAFVPSHAAAPDPAVDYPLERGVEAGQQWKKLLGLSAEQARRFTALENEKTARLKPLRELLRLEMVKLQGYLVESGSERDISDSLEQVLQINRAIAERSAKVDSGLADFLAPSQRARLIVWRSLGGLEGYAARRLESPLRPDEQSERY
jgi:Spy/CpxP family protein refolding chaperone